MVSIIWYRSKAKLKGALARRDSNILKDKSHPHKLPPEIVGMIIAHLAYDIPALKACSATCLTWYNFVCPYLHYTLIFRHKSTGALHSSLDPLLSLRGFGLLPFVRKVQFDGRSPATPWVVPAIFNPRSMRCFRLLDLQELAISHLDFSKFPAGVGEYLGHFSSTLRSLSLMSPLGSRRQLLEFFMLFLRLDNIKICDRRTDERHEALDRRVAPTIKGGLRGQLELKNFNDEGLLKDMIVVFGGLRFTAMRLEGVVGVPLLLRACMNTLEAVYIYPGGTFHPGKTVPILESLPLMPELTSLHQYTLRSSTSRGTLSFDLWRFRCILCTLPWTTTTGRLRHCSPSHPQFSPKSSLSSPKGGAGKNHWLRYCARCTRSSSSGWCFVCKY